MKRNISKQVSKLSVFLVFFIALTLVFTLYQTSVNAYVTDVATELNLTEDGEEILGYTPIKAEAASYSNPTANSFSTFTCMSGDANYWIGPVGTSGGDPGSSSKTGTVYFSDQFVRASHGSAIKYKAVCSITSNGNNQTQNWSVGDSAISTTSTGTQYGAEKVLGAGKTSLAWTLKLNTKWKAASTQESKMANGKVTIIKGESTAPTISSTNGQSLNGADWQTSTSVTISDSGAGLNTISYTYTNLTGSSSSSSPFTASGTSRTTSQTLTLSGEGKYVITATDNVGNSASKTIWKYNSTITATVNNANYGTASVGGTSSTTLTGKFGTQSYDLYASPKTGYYFTGWTSTAGGQGTLGVGSYTSGKWKNSASIPASPTTQTYTWQAQFSEMAPLLNNSGSAVSSGTKSFTYTYDGSPIELTTGSIPSGYSASLTFYGTTLAGNAYAETTAAPTYAGTYTANFNLSYSGNPIGAASFSITINAINVYAYPYFANSNTKVYDGNKFISQTNATDWNLGAESASNSVVTSDKLTFTNNYAGADGFHFNNKNVGSNLDITIEDSVKSNVTISSAKTSDATTNADVAKSYIFNVSTQNTPKGTIKPKLVTISSAGYGQCLNGETAIANLNGFYANGALIPNGTMGKVYDGSTDATLKGIIITGYVDGDDIGFAFSTTGTAYTAKTDGSYILQVINASFANINAGTGKTVTSTPLYLAGNDKINYYVDVDGTTYGDANTAYANQPFALTQEGCAIAQKDVTIVISSVAKKEYDGTNVASVTYTWSIDPIQSQNGVKDNLYIHGADAVVTYDSINANYNVNTHSQIGTALKTVTATGLQIKVGDPNNPNVPGNTDLANYRLTDTTAIKTSASFSEDNYASGAFFAIDTKAITVSLTAEGKTYDGNDVCYNYTLSTDALALDKSAISAKASSVTFNSASASNTATATASGISLESANGSHLNYHLTSTTATHSGLAIARKSISGVIFEAVEDVYYKSAQYEPTPAITDSTLLQNDGATTTSAVLVVGTDFTYGYQGDRTNAGTFTIIVTGTGNYNGTASVTANILKANVKITGVQDIAIIYGQTIGTADITAESIVNNEFNDVAVDGSWTFIDSVANMPIVSASGIKRVQFNPTLSNNYNTPDENTLTLTVAKRNITITAENQGFNFGQNISFNNALMTYQEKNEANTEGRIGTDAFGTLNCVVSNMIYRISDEGATDGKIRCMAGDYAITNEDANGVVTIGNPNYNVNFVPATFTISKHEISLNVVGSNKIYGEADPVLTYEFRSGKEGSVDKDLIDGELERASGENVGTYRISGGTILTSEFNNTNYIFTNFTDANFLISRRQVTLTPASVSNYFGEEVVVSQTDFSVSAVAGNPTSGLASRDAGAVLSDVFTNLNIVLTTEGGNTAVNTSELEVGTYDLLIKAGQNDANPNYTIVVARGKYVINKRPVVITPDAGQGKTYNTIARGNNDPVISYKVTPQAGYEFLGEGLAWKGLSGALTHDTSSPDVGEYAILQGTLTNANNPNYDIKFTSGVTYEIRKLTVIVTPSTKTISVGDPIPADDEFNFSYSPASIVVNNQQIKINLAGKLTVDVSLGVPEDVGSYNLVANEEMLSDANKNFAVTVNGENRFVIQQKTAMITPVLTQKVFGEALSFGVGEGQINLAFSIRDSLSGADLSNLLYGDDAEFSGALSISLQGILDKNAGESDVDYMARVNEYLANPANKAIPVGKYAITIGSLKAKEHNGQANYALELNEVDFEVIKKEIILTVPTTKADGTPNLTKVYDKESDSGIEYAISPATELVAGYPASANSALARESGVNVGSYAITIGNFNIQPENSNYDFVLDGNYSYVISQRFIIVTPVIPDGQTQISSIYGYGDATINYTSYYAFDSTLPGLIGGDTLGGTLARESGSDVREDGYAILAGTLNRDASVEGYNPNYNVTLDSNGIRYYVTRRDVRVQAISVTGKNAQVFGDAEKSLSVTYTAGDLVTGQSALNGAPEREAGIVPGTYAIKQGTMNNENNPNYNVIFTEGSYVINPRPLTVNAKPGQQKGYTTEDPVFEYEVTGGLVEGYDIGLTVTREEGEAPGEKKYGIVFILENNEDCVNNSYYTFSGFTTQAGKYDGKRFYVDKKNAFSISRGTVEIAFNDATTLVDGSYTLTLTYNGEEQFVDSYLKVGGDEKFTDANGNGVWDEGEELVDVNKNGVWDAGVNVRYTVNGKTGKTFKDAGNYTVSIIAATNEVFVGGTFVVNVIVTPKDLGTVNPADYLNASDLTKVYGDMDPSDYTFSMNAMGSDVINATMVREEGENVGSYDLVSISIDNANYKLSFAEGTNEDIFTITAREIVVIPTAKAIKYGVEMTSWTEIVTDVYANEVTVTYTRSDITNDNTGVYDIASYEIDSLNHFVTIAGDDLVGKFVITKVQAIVTAHSKTKTFDGQPIDLSSLTFDYSGMVNDEIPVGSLTIVESGELDLINVGVYSIEAVGFDTASNPNYDMTFVSATYVVNKASITISPDPATVGPYQYGQAIAPFGYVVTLGTVYSGYELVGELGTLSDTSVNLTGHLVPQGTLTNANNPNYAIEYFNNAPEYKCVINKRYVKIKVESATQVYGDPMSALEYHFQDGTSLVGDDVLNGTLSATGEDVGVYNIVMSEAFQNDNPNYEVELDSSDAIYTITARPITITPDAKSVVYGENIVSLTYSATNLADATIYKNAMLNGELLCVIGSNVGQYEILQGSLGNSNYDITFISGVYYEITPRDITVTINNAESEYGAEDVELTYTITKGYLIGADDLGVTLVRESGTEMGFYEISGSSSNTNYNVTFVNATYTIKKYKAVITVAEQFISFVEDGNARTISATCSSGAEITYTIDFEPVHNFFKNAGKYVVELNAPETESYYAPESVTVYITINRPFIQSEANGIDVRLETENGFDPSLHVEMSKLPADYADIQAELKSNQKIVRAFSLTTSSDVASNEMVPGKATITIKVPSSLQEEQVVQVIVQENGVYNQIEVDVIDGYVTLEVDSISNFAFIVEESNNYFIIIILGAAALIVLGSVMVFLFRKRA